MREIRVFSFIEALLEWLGDSEIIQETVISNNLKSNEFGLSNKDEKNCLVLLIDGAISNTWNSGIKACGYCFNKKLKRFYVSKYYLNTLAYIFFNFDGYG